MLWLIGFIGSILAANVLIEQFGAVPVGFGLMAPAGVYAAGFAFVARDGVHERYGPRGALVAILAGAVLSWWVSPAFAVASGVAFALSEFCDFAVYAPLRRRSWLGAALASNSVGLVVDSAIFLGLAFSSLEYMPGQVMAKMYVTLAGVAALAAWRHRAWLRRLAWA